MILINGQPGEQLSVLDRGLQYGDGLFETIAVKDSKLRYWDLHWQRFSKGCKRLNLPSPDESQCLAEINQVLENQSQAVIKLIYTRGAGGRGYRFTEMQPTRIVMRHPWPEYGSANTQGIALYLCETRIAVQPKLAGIKHLNRLENVLARNEWQDDYYAEGLMLSTDDNVIEGTMSNVFLVQGNTLLTPDLTQCGVQGVMRQHLLNLASQYKMKIQIRNLTMDDVTQAEEMFVCNSLFGIWPVQTIGDKTFNTENPLTQRLQQLIEQE